MSMKSTMTIRLDFGRGSFHASAHITCPQNRKKRLTFALNNDLTITSLTGNVPVTFRKAGEASGSRSGPWPKGSRLRAAGRSKRR